MRLYIFRSETKSDLRAFSGDPAGSKLPAQFRPWRATGTIGPDSVPPYNLPRETIEAAVGDRGFQLWRLKTSAA